MKTGRHAAAGRFAWLVTRVELAMILTRPWTRFTGVIIWIILILVTAELAILLPWATVAIAIIGSTAISVLAILGMVTIAMLVGERAQFLNARHAWYLHDERGERGAYLRDRKGNTELCSVTASPRGQGLGEELLLQVVQHTTDTEIGLRAVNRRVATWYARHGFRTHSRGPRGIHMTRSPQPPPPEPHGPAAHDRPQQTACIE